jgi:CheY-like chemotaxis protein
VDMSSVLLVEDELLVRELASEDLGDAGFQVTAATDGDEALGYLREGRQFDLLFTDIRMPGTTDGWQLAEAAKELLPDIRVIYATGLGDAANGLADGERYVRKPYSLNDLRSALTQLGFAEGKAA